MNMDLNGVTYEPFPTYIVQAVDLIVETAHKNGSTSGFVETEADWKTLETIYKVWVKLFPEDVDIFVASMDKIRSGLHNEHGAADEASFLQHQLEMPQLFHDMFRKIFPLQKFDKKFVASFVKKMPVFKVTKSNL